MKETKSDRTMNTNWTPPTEEQLAQAEANNRLKWMVNIPVGTVITFTDGAGKLRLGTIASVRKFSSDYPDVPYDYNVDYKKSFPGMPGLQNVTGKVHNDDILTISETITRVTN